MNEMVNVSGYKNNCGLYALALGVRISSEGQAEETLGKIPKEVIEIQARDVLPSADRNTLERNGQLLRQCLFEALSQDQSFKEGRLESFIQLCDDLLVNTDMYEKDMEAFYKSCHLFIAKLEELIAKELEEQIVFSWQNPLIDPTEEISILSQIKNIMNGEKENFFQELQQLFGIINSCQDVYDKCCLFKSAWGFVGEDFDTEKRESLKLASERWFYEQSLILLGKATQEEFSSFLYQLSVSYSVMIGLDKTNGARYLLIRFNVKNFWEDFLYPCYLDYLKTPVMLSVDELGCLARYWKVRVTIEIGSRFFQTGEETDKIFDVHLCNPSRDHWQVRASVESLVKFDPTQERRGKAGLGEKSNGTDNIDLSSFRPALPRALLPSEYQQNRILQAVCLDHIAFENFIRLSETRNYIGTLQDTEITWIRPKFVELFRLKSLLNKTVNFAVPVLKSKFIETEPLLQEKREYLFCVIDFELYNSFGNEQLIIHYTKNVAAAMQEEQKTNNCVVGAGLLLKGRVPTSLLSWLRGSTPLDPSPVPDVEILYAIPVDGNTDSEEYMFTLKQGGKYRLRKKNEKLVSLLGRNIHKKWSTIWSITVIDALIEGANGISSTFQDFIYNFWQGFFDKFDYERDTPEWDLFLIPAKKDALLKLIDFKINSVLELKKEEIFVQLVSSLINTLKYHLNASSSQPVSERVRALIHTLSEKNHTEENLERVYRELEKSDLPELNNILKKLGDCIFVKKNEFNKLSDIGESQRHVDRLLKIKANVEQIRDDVFERCCAIAKQRKPSPGEEIFDLSYSHLVDDSINKKKYTNNFELIETLTTEKLEGYNQEEYLYESEYTLCFASTGAQPRLSVDAYVSRFSKVMAIEKGSYTSYTFAQIINLFLQFEPSLIKKLFQDYLRKVKSSLKLKKTERSTLFHLMGKFSKEMRDTKNKYERAKSEYESNKKIDVVDQANFDLKEFCNIYFSLCVKKGGVEKKLDKSGMLDEKSAKDRCNDFLLNHSEFDMEFYCLEFFLFNHDNGTLKDAMKYRHSNFEAIISAMDEVLKEPWEEDRSAESKEDNNKALEVSDVLKQTPFLEGLSYLVVCQMITSREICKDALLNAEDKYFDAINSLFQLLPEKEKPVQFYIYNFELRKNNVVKFIYAISQDHQIFVGHERILSGASQRAAHSELAKGLGVRAAGEMIFYKSSESDWLLIEVNNGSGHYRPKASLMLESAKNSIVSSLGRSDIKTHNVRMVNSLRPGMGLGSHFRSGEICLTLLPRTPNLSNETAEVKNTPEKPSLVEPLKESIIPSHVSFWKCVTLTGAALVAGSAFGIAITSYRK